MSEIQLKTYQEKALKQVDRWIDELNKARVVSASGREEVQGLKDYPMLAWKSLEAQGCLPSAACSYVSRTAKSGEPIPHACLKVPTGGGKTLLGVRALQCLKQETGFVLWVVPSKAIYDQTYKAFRTRGHPYRQRLEVLSGRRVKVFQKNDHLTKEHTEHYLCVMMLMLSSANRKTNKEFLKMFRNSSGYQSFFPEEDDVAANGRLLEQHADLETNAEGQVKQSFFNVLKLIRPTVILDEAHKAYGKNQKGMEEFTGTINRLNPYLVLELSATPTLGKSNILVDISGRDLQSEEMIKLPIAVSSFSNSDWQRTLDRADEKLAELDREAQRLHQKQNRYVRPMALVRVQRTGSEKREQGKIHSEDAREYLIQKLSVPEHEIRVQSSTQKELGDEDLLSEQSQVRWIITKDALKEGWDCSFAYVLALLDNTKATTTMVQMVGRILRQPQASRIETSDALNQCYVYCYNQDLGEVIKGVKSRLEEEGLRDISNNILSWQDGPAPAKQEVKRRCKHRGLDIFLPKVLHKAGRGWRELDYNQDILAHLNWETIHVNKGSRHFDDKDIALEHQAVVVLDSEKRISTKNTEAGEEDRLTLDWFVRRIVDGWAVLNPWQMARIVDDFLQEHKCAGHPDAKLQKNRYHLLQVLQEGIRGAVDRKAEALFLRKVQKNEIRFYLHADKDLNYALGEAFEVAVGEGGTTLPGEHGKPIQRSLFEPVYESDFTGLEKEFALYLDGNDAVNWWHKIAARQQSYSLQGWQKRRVYPDFLVLLHGEDKGFLILETKGDHLKGNDDTEYKKKLLTTLETIYKKSTCRGEVELGSPPGPPARLRMMFETGEDGWKEEIRRLLHENPTVSQYEKNGSVSSKNLQK